MGGAGAGRPLPADGRPQGLDLLPPGVGEEHEHGAQRRGQQGQAAAARDVDDGRADHDGGLVFLTAPLCAVFVLLAFARRQQIKALWAAIRR